MLCKTLYTYARDYISVCVCVLAGEAQAGAELKLDRKATDHLVYCNSAAKLDVWQYHQSFPGPLVAEGFRTTGRR